MADLITERVRKIQDLLKLGANDDALKALYTAGQEIDRMEVDGERAEIVIREDDGPAEACDPQHSDRLTVCSCHTLLIGGMEVIQWSRASTGEWEDGEWAVGPSEADHVADELQHLLLGLGLPDSDPRVPRPE